MIIDYYASANCDKCGGNGIIFTHHGTAGACHCNRMVLVNTEPEKLPKPKKGHFRERYGESGKKHWQK